LFGLIISLLYLLFAQQLLYELPVDISNGKNIAFFVIFQKT
jgi:hypothetical protein